MILKGFKEKSNKNYINFQLENRTLSESEPNTRIKTIGLLFNANDIRSKPDIKVLATLFNVNEDEINIIAFKSKINSNEELCYPIFSTKHIGWKGVIKDNTLQHFLNMELDILISYYKQDLTALKLLTVSSKAKFKIGILEADERINDLIIKTGVYEFKTFTSELKKYLNILNKI